MHNSVMDFVERQAIRSCHEGYRVLEIGSKDVNGTPRSAIIPRCPNGFYIGLDIRVGDGVNLLCDITQPIDKLPHELFTFWSMIVCTEVLEHVYDWKSAVENIKYLSSPGTIVIMTTRGPGFARHDHPGDYWRFTSELFKAIWSDFETIECIDDPEMSGVLYCGIRPNPLANHMKALPVE